MLCTIITLNITKLVKYMIKICKIVSSIKKVCRQVSRCHYH